MFCQSFGTHSTNELSSINANGEFRLPAKNSLASLRYPGPSITSFKFSNASKPNMKDLFKNY